MNLRQLVFSRPKLLAGGAAAALVVGLGFGWLARAPIDTAFAHPPAVAPNLTIDTSGVADTQQAVLDTPDAPASPASAPITAEVYSASGPLTTAPRPRAARMESAPAASDQQLAAYDETPPRGDGAEDPVKEDAPGYPPLPPP